MSKESLKLLESTLSDKGTHKYSDLRQFLTVNEQEHSSRLVNSLDFLRDCLLYQKFTKKYHQESIVLNTTVPLPQPTSTTSDILKNCSQIPFMKRPPKISLEKYNQELDKIKVMLVSIQDLYLTGTSEKSINLEASIHEPLVKLITKGYCHHDILSQAYSTTASLLLPFYIDFTAQNSYKPSRRSSLLAYFTEKPLDHSEKSISLFQIHNSESSTIFDSLKKFRQGSAVSSINSDEMLDEVPRTQSRKNSRFDASLSIVSEMFKVDEIHSAGE
jgi:hypothetical protein